MELQTRKPNRLKNYDYSQNGAYFITICVQDRKPILSQIIVGEGLAPPATNNIPKRIMLFSAPQRNKTHLRPMPPPECTCIRKGRGNQS